MKMLRLSILPFLVAALVGGADARFLRRRGDNDAAWPMASASMARRVCVGLCAAGLGGEPCGEGCLDILPPGLLYQSQNDSDVGITRTASPSKAPRRDACELLCSYNLGYPLCGCQDEGRTRSVNRLDVDFNQICGFFCLKYNHRILGCQPCHVYEARNHTDDSDVFRLNSGLGAARKGVDWDEWCRERCSEGDGGAACNCDILPFSLL